LGGFTLGSRARFTLRGFTLRARSRFTLRGFALGGFTLGSRSRFTLRSFTLRARLRFTLCGFTLGSRSRFTLRSFTLRARSRLALRARLIVSLGAPPLGSDLPELRGGLHLTRIVVGHRGQIRLSAVQLAEGAGDATRADEHLPLPPEPVQIAAQSRVQQLERAPRVVVQALRQPDRDQRPAPHPLDGAIKLP